ncbi:long-chain-fatty-acid--CoA ligase [Corynebacterium diphtheriae]|uniref:Long-chain-fatty-acid--CoA ligase n=2 Tax=Corynebacterium diphtheriae TaxID=1717 RepID=A0A6J4W701_CORDP|nr:long-chain-fatty-acid--CoA ligase [Corynebacterium diphtheriae]ERA58922.1 long-chain-fatty-acid--CoA ligase [Corynebacterium diphtheriae DSM 43988]OWN06705.1 long-chain fatty acid--CoA ligase [Corynebacterium belfantii]AEX45611.1 acyl-CoA synthetase [Corynebacterium diphtheriae INCA 402]AEX47850.1 acyl-CoA synthetase [Corynebacterium diphtheriae BH8]AEX66529.1 acyl-CoA synthetase [Corynebacterium diphtheriae C7 (beta)]
MGAFDDKAWLQHYGDWTPASLDYGDTTLVDIYDNNLAVNADKPATYFFGRTQTYAELDAQVRAAAAGLKAFGIRPGDRVAIVLPNCPQHIAAFYAIQLLGATVVEHNPLYTAHELEGLFQDHGARVAIAWDKAASTLEKLRDTTSLETIISVNMTEAMPRIQQLALRIPIPPIAAKREQLTAFADNTVPWSTLIGNAIGGNGKRTEFPKVTRDDIALILYTSGTTGTPKGALLSHGNLVSNCFMGKAWVPGLGDQPERFLAALPMFHAYGMTMVGTLGVFVGAEMVLLPAPQIPLIMKIMKNHTPTWLPGVPTLYEKIVAEATAKGVEIKGIRNSFSGASTLPVRTVEDWENLTGGLLVEGYGLTETSPVLCGNPMNGNRRPGYIGVPFPDTEIRIANPDNLDETMPDGEAGEVLARGPQIFQGYLNKPEATAATFHGDWFRTGDMGVMEEDGFIRLVSRIKEIIITGGFNVYPAEVEEALIAHPDVDDAAVVGRPRKDGSEDVVACIVLKDGAALDPEGLKTHCRKLLTRYKVPRTFYHFEALNKDQLGKVRRREVQQTLLERLGEK